MLTHREGFPHVPCVFLHIDISAGTQSHTQFDAAHLLNIFFLLIWSQSLVATWLYIVQPFAQFPFWRGKCIWPHTCKPTQRQHAHFLPLSFDSPRKCCMKLVHKTWCCDHQRQTLCGCFWDFTTSYCTEQNKVRGL